MIFLAFRTTFSSTFSNGDKLTELYVNLANIIYKYKQNSLAWVNYTNLIVFAFLSLCNT